MLDMTTTKRLAIKKRLTMTETTIRIRPRPIQRFDRKLGDYAPARDLFAGYKVGEIAMTKIGRRIQILGPKKEFFLYEARNGLTIIAPPKEDGGDAIKQHVPLFFVSGMSSSGKIQGADFFALIDDELVAYRSEGQNRVAPL